MGTTRQNKYFLSANFFKINAPFSFIGNYKVYTNATPIPGKNAQENQSSAEQIDHPPMVFKIACCKAIFNSSRSN